MSTTKANLFMKFNNSGSGVYLFTAKDGQRMPKILKRALIRGQARWSDTAYLTRIIFSELIQNDVLSEHGYGISPTLGDNDNWILVVDDKNEKVGIFNELGRCFVNYSFSQYISLSDNALEWYNLSGYDEYLLTAPSGRRTADPYPM